MKYQNQEEIEEFARQFIILRNKAKRSKNIKTQRKFAEYQNLCVQKFGYLIAARVNKYRKFPNYEDLEQDGFEALVMAFRTYDPKKGSFTWWADKYISTRVARSANRHSTIRFPLKKAKELKPYKAIGFPVIIDPHPSPAESFFSSETKDIILNAVEDLPDLHKELISLIYGFYGMKPRSIDSTLETLSISRSQGMRLLEEAKNKLREKLNNCI